MTKLHRLKIEKLRAVEPCELHFNDGLNVLLGRNGSGKTTLLRLIADLYASPINDILPGEEYELEVEFRFAVGSVTTHIKSVLAQHDQAQASGANQGEGPNDLEIKVHIDFEDSLRFDAEYPHPKIHSGWQITRDQQVMLSGANPRQFHIIGLFQQFVAGISTESRTKLLSELGQTYLPSRMDESIEALELMRRMRRGFSYSGATKEVFFNLGEGPMPRDYLNAFDAIVQAAPDISQVVITDDQLDFLKRFVQMTGFKSARMVSERTEKHVRNERVGSSFNVFSNIRFSFTRHDGSEFWQEQLSYGQKRLLVFLYYLNAVPQILIADELVNGLHHEWIEYCATALRDRQSFVSSHNPLLLDHLWFSSQEEVRQSFLLCTNTREQSRDVLLWRNMTDKDAAVFYQAYQVNIQHVSEILHSEGLW